MRGPAGRWIPTERTHPHLLKIPLGIDLAIFLFVIVSIAFSSGPPLSITGVAAILALFAIVLGCVDAVLVVSQRPSAIRVSTDGIELRRTFYGTVRFPASSMVIWPRSPDGFGFIPTGLEGGYYLSPDQFAAVRAAFPDRVRVPGEASPPLR